MFNGLSAKKVYDTLVNKALTITAFNELGDSNIKRILHRDFHIAETEYHTFNHKQGRMANGLTIEVDTPHESYNVLTNLIMESSHYGEISKSNVRFGNNRESLLVYVNGVKIPDSMVYMYCTDSNTNVILPRKFFDKEIINDILIEKRRFLNYSYAGTYVKSFNDDRLVFPISAHRNVTANIDTTLIFVDGLYGKDLIESVTQENGFVYVKFKSNVTGEIEAFVDSSITYTKQLKINGTYKVPFSISDTFVDPLYGPINKDNCLFFVNGKRASNKEVQQVGRLNFEYELEAVENGIVSDIIFTDEDIIGLTDDKIYGDDYFLYNFIGGPATTVGLIGGNTNSIFDGNVDLRNVLDPGFKYSDMIKLKEDLAKHTSDEVRVQSLLKYNPSLLKLFLELFSTQPLIYDYDYTGEDTVTLTSIGRYDPGTKVLRIVTVNDRIVRSEEFITDSVTWYWKFDVDGSHFKLGKNTVSITEIARVGDGRSHVIGNIIRHKNIFGDIRYRCIADTFGSVESVDDLRLLVVTNKEFDEDGVYFRDDKFGFRVVDYPTIIIDGKIHIEFGAEDPRIDTLVLSTIKHHAIYNFTINSDETYEDLFNEISVGTIQHFSDNEYHSVNIPLIHDGSMIVSYDPGIRLFNNVDYFYRSPETNDTLRSSGLILKRKLEIGTTVSVGLLPRYIQSEEYPVMSIEDTGPNKYGLLYLGGLKFPFSHDYINVYANNKKIYPKDIDILSNKLIRLNSAEVSLQNVYVEMNFDTSFDKLKPYMDTYNDSEFEKFIELTFRPYNFSNSIGMNSSLDARNLADLIYESFVDGVDSNAKTPNPLRTKEYVSAKYDLYIDAYVRWFISTDSDGILDSIRDIPQDVLDVLEIYYDGPLDTNDRTVVITPHSQDLIDDVIFTVEGYPGFDRGETIKNFLECSMENNLTIEETYEDYEDHYHSNIVYKSDLVDIDADYEFDGDDIIIGG